MAMFMTNGLLVGIPEILAGVIPKATVMIVYLMVSQAVDFLQRHIELFCYRLLNILRRGEGKPKLAGTQA